MSNGSTNAVQRSSNRKTHPTFHFLAGLASGISSAVLLQPADLLKTRVQQSRSSSLLPVLRSILSGPSPVTSLWRGTAPSALRTGFGSALYFTSLNTLRQLVANKSAGTENSLSVADGVLPSSNSSSVLPKLNNTQNLLTGATARVFAGLILMPVTVIKVRYESDFYNYKSILSASRAIYQGEGAKGFFSGFGATAVRDAPYAGLYVVFYEACKTRLNKFATKDGDRTGAGAAAGINATSGVIAAGTATAITNPFDAVKTRLQLMPQKYGNMVKATKLMLLEDGMRGFFDGLALRMGRKAISSALAWTVYEELIGRAQRTLLSEDRQAVL